MFIINDLTSTFWSCCPLLKWSILQEKQEPINSYFSIQDKIVLLTIMLLLSLSVISDFVTILGFTFNSNCKILDLCLTYCLLAGNLFGLVFCCSCLFLITVFLCSFLLEPLSFYFKSSIYSLGLAGFLFYLFLRIFLFKLNPLFWPFSMKEL